MFFPFVEVFNLLILKLFVPKDIWVNSLRFRGKFQSNDLCEQFSRILATPYLVSLWCIIISFGQLPCCINYCLPLHYSDQLRVLLEGSELV